jgi:indole-3-glycerol phosphate synthase
MIFVNGKQVQLIAEVKTHSPFGFDSNKTWDELFNSANEFGDIISIHTDPRWNGSFELIRKAKSLSTKSILAKGIHATDDLIEKAVQAGADFVLVVGRIPAVHLDKCLTEPNFLDELKTIPHTMKVVWNSRDLKTGGLKQETFKEARKIFPGWLCQASNIKTIDDVEEGADAVLVGQNLEGFIESMR